MVRLLSTLLMVGFSNHMVASFISVANKEIQDTFFLFLRIKIQKFSAIAVHVVATPCWIMGMQELHAG